MAYLLTAIMTGGVAALISLFTGGAMMQIVWNYILFGHFGMATLALATVVATLFDRKHRSRA